jgi:hypothetical protein
MLELLNVSMLFKKLDWRRSSELQGAVFCIFRFLKQSILACLVVPSGRGGSVSTPEESTSQSEENEKQIFYSIESLPPFRP